MTFQSDAATAIAAFQSAATEVVAVLDRSALAADKGAAAEATIVELRAEIARLNAQGSSDAATIAELRARIAVLEGTVTPPPPGPVDPPPVTPADPRPLLSWKPPVLTNPITVDLAAAKPPVELKSGKLILSTSADYIVRLPTDRPWANIRGLHIEGGRNVVVIGGLVDVGPGFYSGGTGPGVMANGYVKRACYLLGQTGTVHLEGVAFTSSTGDLSEGLDMSAANAVVHLQNLAFLVPANGSKAANHADLVQTWNGPRWLGIDGLEGVTGYQGMFLNAHDLGSGTVDPDWVLRNIEIVGNAQAKYILWVTAPPSRVLTDQVYTSGGLGNYDAANDWPGVKHGVRAPAAVLAGPRSAGLGYTTPGYR